MEAETHEIKIKLEAEVQERKCRFEAEAGSARLELDDKEMQRQHKFRFKRLEGNLTETEDSHKTDRFRLASTVKFVPKFTELDAEHCLLSFEK